MTREIEIRYIYKWFKAKTKYTVDENIKQPIPLNTSELLLLVSCVHWIKQVFYGLCRWWYSGPFQFFAPWGIKLFFQLCQYWNDVRQGSYAWLNIIPTEACTASLDPKQLVWRTGNVCKICTLPGLNQHVRCEGWWLIFDNMDNRWT